MSAQGWILMLAGLAVSVLADTGLMMLLLRVLSGVPVPWRDLSQGAVVGGVGFSLLKLSAATLLPRVTANPLFASIAIVVGLLFWLNLIARLTLIAAAWAANDVDAIHGGEARARVRASSHSPDTVGMPETASARGGSLPTFGARSGDRATLGAGVVLGAASTVATGALAAGIRSVLRRAKG
jgi:membrane protein